MSDSTDDTALSRADAKEESTILVVDHEVLVRMVIADYLRKCGYRVVEAASAEEAMAILRHEDMAVDVVLSDAELPGPMDGFALAQWIRRSVPDLGVILVGSPHRAAQAAADLCQDGPLLSRPYEPEQVADRIRFLLAQRARTRA